MNRLFTYDKDVRNRGYNLVAGVDEAGRGPLAGPVVAAAVILSSNCYINGLKDSKKLSPKKRYQIYKIIHQEAIDIAIGIVDVETIDKINILQASLLAMKRAIRNLKQTPEYLLIDGPFSPLVNIPRTTIINGEDRSAVIASASIVAKVIRDNIMIRLHEKYPLYCFNKHKGYGTSLHISILNQHGPCRIHRQTFNRVKNCDILNIKAKRT